MLLPLKTSKLLRKLHEGSEVLTFPERLVNYSMCETHFSFVNCPSDLKSRAMNYSLSEIWRPFTLLYGSSVSLY